jgi:Sulfotransferase domain
LSAIRWMWRFPTRISRAGPSTPQLKTWRCRKSMFTRVMGSWSQHVASWIGLCTRPVHIMRYEDMLADPVRSFDRLARFLRLTPTEAQLKSAIGKSSFADLARQGDEHGFREKPANAEKFFRTGRSGQWVETLSPAQVREIVRAHAPMMQRFGYLQADCGMPVSLARTIQEL